MKKTASIILLQILGVGFLSATFVFSQTESNSKMVLLRASVIDKRGKVVEGLKQEQFTVENEGIEQKISYFSNKEEPYSISILFDISASVEQTSRYINAKSALNFIQKANPQNEYSMIAFNSEVIELTDWGKDQKQIADLLNKIIEPKKIDAKTVFYNALVYAEKKFKDSKYANKALLIFSDGQDNASSYDYKTVNRMLEESDAVIYSIRLTDHRDAKTIENIQGQALLDELAKVSGGSAFYARKATEMEEIIESVSAELKSRYAIGYIPKEPLNSKDRGKIKLKVIADDAKGKKLKLTTRIRASFVTKEN